MKNTYSLIIVLLLVFASLQAQSDKMFAEMGLTLDLQIEKEGNQKPLENSNAQELLPFLLSLELLLLDTALEVTENSINTIPKYLSSLHLLDIEPSKNGNVSNSLSYAVNFNQPFENTFFPWLKPMKYESRNPQQQQQLSRGFGPTIRI